MRRNGRKWQRNGRGFTQLSINEKAVAKNRGMLEYCTMCENEGIG
jgi:hypothetical protein